jgi:hypothetical protein
MSPGKITPLLACIHGWTGPSNANAPDSKVEANKNAALKQTVNLGKLNFN